MDRRVYRARMTSAWPVMSEPMTASAEPLALGGWLTRSSIPPGGVGTRAYSGPFKAGHWFGSGTRSKWLVFGHVKGGSLGESRALKCCYSSASASGPTYEPAAHARAVTDNRARIAPVGRARQRQRR